jgi:hypothetical protein
VLAGIAERRFASIIADLDIPQPFDLGRFLTRLAIRRNRRIYLHSFTSGPGVPCGLWLGTIDADHVFHEEGTTPWHKTHITLHEVAHMLLGHGGGGSRRGLGSLLAPDIDPALTRLILGRGTYTTAEERDAETVASLILGQASDSPPQLPAGGTMAKPVLYRLERAWDR